MNRLIKEYYYYIKDGAILLRRKKIPNSVNLLIAVILNLFNKC